MFEQHATKRKPMCKRKEESQTVGSEPEDQPNKMQKGRKRGVAKATAKGSEYNAADEAEPNRPPTQVPKSKAAKAKTRKKDPDLEDSAACERLQIHKSRFDCGTP